MIPYSTNDMRVALALPESARVLREAITRSRILCSSYVKDDQYGTAYNEGLRAFGLWLKNEIDKADTEAFYRIMSEQSKEFYK